MSTPSTVGAGSSNSTVSGASSTHSHALDVTGNVAVLTWTIAHGGTIPLPSGYTEAQCKWSVSINSQVTALSTAKSNLIKVGTNGSNGSNSTSKKYFPQTGEELGNYSRFTPR